MVLRPEGVVSTYGFLPIYFIFPRIGQSSWSRFGAFSWVLIGLYCLRRPANLNVSCDRAVNCECWVRLIVSKSFSGTQLLQLASPLQLNQVTVCSCRVLNRRVISVYVLLLAWNSKVSSCSPSWLYVFVAVSWSQAVYHEIASVMLLGLKGIVSTFGYLIHKFTFSRVSQSSRARFGGVCVCKAGSIFSYNDANLNVQCEWATCCKCRVYFDAFQRVSRDSSLSQRL